MAEEDTYDGIAIPDLRVDSVIWTTGQTEHVRTRSSRYPSAVNLEPEWATEAAMDPKRRFGLDGEQDGRGNPGRRPIRHGRPSADGHPDPGRAPEAHEAGGDADNEEGRTSR